MLALQLSFVLFGLALSRASSLPQGNALQMVGASLLAKTA
jgi:hypothetical protein